MVFYIVIRFVAYFCFLQHDFSPCCAFAHLPFPQHLPLLLPQHLPSAFWHFFSHVAALAVPSLAVYPIFLNAAFKDFTFTAAYRLTDVKVDYGQGLTRKPLTSRHKGLFTASYAPMMGLWQFDVTCSINGGGRMPSPYITSDGSQSWKSTYHPYAQLNAQITRNFRHWSIYVGGENLTAYRQKNPIVGAMNPWGDNFDATMVYAPLHGAIIYAGFRYILNRY